MTCMAARRAPAAPGRYIAIERLAGGGDRLLCTDGHFAPAVGGTASMAVFPDPAAANQAVARAVNRRHALPVEIIPLRGPVRIEGGVIGSAIGALVVAGVTIITGAIL